MVTSELLVIRDLGLMVGNHQLLQSLSFVLQSGEPVCVVGPNGAGKTTLLKVVAGLSRGYSGSVLLQQREVRDERPDRLAHIVGFVPQRLEHLPCFSVAEFLELSGNARKEAVTRLTDHVRNRYLPELSGGELQRVLLAGALAQGVRLLLLDEPTSNLDPTGRAEVEVLLDELAQEDVTLMMVTHDISLAVRCSTRLVIMSQGSISWSGGVNDEALVSELGKAYRCRFLRVEHHDLQRPLIVAQ